MEVIISLTIVAMAGVFLAGFFTSQLSVYDGAAKKTEAQTVCSTVMNMVEKEVRYGQDFTVTDNVLTYTLVTEEEAIPGQQVDGNTIGSQLFPDYEKQGKHIAVSFRFSGDLLRVVVTIKDMEHDQELGHSVRTIRCFNAASMQPESQQLLAE